MYLLGCAKIKAGHRQYPVEKGMVPTMHAVSISIIISIGTLLMWSLVV